MLLFGNASYFRYKGDFAFRPQPNFSTLDSEYVEEGSSATLEGDVS